METILQKFSIENQHYSFSTGQNSGGDTGEIIKVYSPVDASEIGSVYTATDQDYESVLKTAVGAIEDWKKIPAPQRGEIVRQIGDELRLHKEDLGRLVSSEMGKIYQEGLGEVQEMIDICDFAVGLSRQLYGLTMHSERPGHRMYEQYHPLGVVGVISSFNFPVAVWAWNAMLAAVCGNVCVWKPSEKTPLTAIACQAIVAKVLKKNNLPEGIFNLVIGGKEIGEKISKDRRVALVSATGSTAMGKKVARVVSERLGKTILELGGNNAIILTKNADLKLALPGIVFGAVGTAGQRCTSTRRLIIHESIYDQVKETLLKAYSGLAIGSPLDASTHVGPLIDELSVRAFENAISEAKKAGGNVLIGGEVLENSGYYVKPAIVEAKNSYAIVQEETFAPILYLLKYSGDVHEAIKIQNDVKQGLSSAIFTESMKEAETFLSALGSDCGIANVNIGTSGAEIGGAFGGEKDTGGGRESGSDAWKAYMRRQTNTINYSNDLPLAQGIKFDI